MRIKVLKYAAVSDKEKSLGNKMKNVSEASDPFACRILPLELTAYLLDNRIITCGVVEYKASYLNI
jgi:hypothetical protein